MKTATTLMFATVLGLVAAAAAPARAQSQRQAEYLGSRWGYFFYETGAGFRSALTGRPTLHEGQPEAVITVMSRDGQPLTEADRDAAIGLARGLCEQSGRHFNTRTRGHWLTNGGLGFQGECRQW
ncbi:MAG: hypothetical protein Kow0013_09990 [Pararhodobacter sp.]